MWEMLYTISINISVNIEDTTLSTCVQECTTRFTHKERYTQTKGIERQARGPRAAPPTMSNGSRGADWPASVKWNIVILFSLIRVGRNHTHFGRSIFTGGSPVNAKLSSPTQRTCECGAYTSSSLRVEIKRLGRTECPLTSG